MLAHTAAMHTAFCAAAVPPHAAAEGVAPATPRRGAQPLAAPTHTPQVAQNCDVVFVSVKPQYVHTVLTEARPALRDGSLVISIAAGITLSQLLEAAGPNARVCRVMPNTPCLVGETAAAMCLGGKVRVGCWAGRRACSRAGHCCQPGQVAAARTAA